MKDNLFQGEVAKIGLMNGVKKVASAVGATMGTSGNNSLIQCIERPGHFSTNDGFSIANSIRLSEPLEELGRSVLIEAINRANKSSGDGSSTTCVLTSSILEEGMKHLNEVPPMELKRSLEACIPLIEESIKSQTKEITTDNLAPVASISAEDESIGNLIQEIYQKIGKEGIVSWDISKTSEDYYTIGNGLTINGTSYVSPYMCDVDESGRFKDGIRWKNPTIILARQKIMSPEDLNPILGTLFSKDIKEVVIFCEEIEMPMVSNLIKTRIERGFKTMVVKMPIIWRDEWWEDLSVASGAKIADGIGLKLKDLKEEHLGTFGDIIVTKEETYIDGIKDLSAHIEKLKEQDTESSAVRIGRLNTKTAKYFIGAHSESALAYKRLKVEDALNAAACALEHGIVVGGGIALLNASKSLMSEGIGNVILKQALKEPLKKIVENSGSSLIEIEPYLNGNIGFNSKTQKVEDLFESGIVDPADVVLNAVKNAIGVAASILTIGTVVLLPEGKGNV